MEPTKAGAVSGAVASGSIANGIAVIIKLELNKHGFSIDDSEALALVPVMIVVVHPIGMLVNSIVDWIVYKLKTKENVNG